MITKNKNKKSLMNMLRKMSIVPVALVALYLFGCNSENNGSYSEIRTHAEQMPTFNGKPVLEGFQEISNNLNKPLTNQTDIQRFKMLSGTLSFVVNEKGSIEDVKLVDFNASVDLQVALSEIEHVLASAQKWTPGQQNKKDVSVFINIPIVIAIAENGSIQIFRTRNNTNNAESNDERVFNVSGTLLRSSERQDGEPFTVVEEMPVFPGGDEALLKYIAENLRYPESAQKNNIQGRVYIQFAITSTGTIGEVKIMRGVDPELDAEAVRVIKSLPAFTPGKQGGVAVPVWYSVPILFQL